MSTFDRAVAAVLRRQSEAVEPGADAPELRKVMVSAIDDALTSNAEARRANPGRSADRVAPWVLLAVAAVALLVAGAVLLKDRASPEQPQKTIIVEPTDLPLAGGGHLTRGPTAKVDVTDNGTVATLRMGEVAAEVLTTELRIDTTDAQFFVRSASVTLETGAGCDGRVKLKVKSGEARVRIAEKEVTVKAGEEWPSCAPSTPPETVGVVGTPEPKKVPVVVKKELSLSDQNDLFERALALQKGGDMQGAVVLLERIVTEAPDSALAEPALAQELRWLAPERSEQALVIARRYLKKFPMGSARAEAEKLVAPPPPR